MKSVVINSDKSIGYIEEYKGHALLNVREWDPGTAVKPEGVYVLEFSDEPVCGVLDAEEQREAIECWELAAKNLSLSFYERLHTMLTERHSEVGPYDTDGGEDE